MPTDLTPEAREALRRLAESGLTHSYVLPLLDALKSAEAERDRLRAAARQAIRLCRELRAAEADRLLCRTIGGHDHAD